MPKSKKIKKALPKSRLLVVEDSEILQMTIADMLEKLHLEFDIANNGLEAIEVAKKNLNYETILMDCMMPKMDGFEATKKIRTEFNGRKFSIIGLTGLTSPEERQKCYDAGMDLVLTKPIKLATLKKALEQGEAPVEKNAMAEIVGKSLAPESLSFLESLRDGNPQFIKKLLETFFRLTPDLLNELGEAIQSGDAKKVNELSHHFKGICLNVGASNLVTIVAMIEEDSAQGDLVGSQVFLDRIREEYTGVRASLEVWLRQQLSKAA